MRKTAWMAAAFFGMAAAVASGQEGARVPMVFRGVKDKSLQGPETAAPVPPEAIRVYLHEGEARDAWVYPTTIAVEYGNSGVLFDRATGRVASRRTVLEGWPAVRGKEFPGRPSRRQPRLLGPGVLEAWADPDDRPRRTVDGGVVAAESHVAAARAVYGGRVWEAMHPVGFFQGLANRAGGYMEQRKAFGTWTNVLKAASEGCYVQSSGEKEKWPAGWYSTQQGLPGNVVTHLAAGQGKLWAACVDIYDPQAGAWGPGGLACYDDKADRWSRVATIDGRAVRWVTLLQTVGDDVWVGFREGAGVAGDKITYGKGLYAQQYRPVTTAVVLARLSKGKWTTFSRPPAAVSPEELALAPGKRKELGEAPRTLAVVGERVFLFSQSQARASGNWDTTWAGLLSAVDTATGRWRTFDAEKELAAYELRRMVADDGEVLVLTDGGVRRWAEKESAWRALEPGGVLVNPNVSALVPVGNETWVGYSNQSFGVLGRQGISRLNEETMTWSRWDERQIGTACPVMAIVPLAGETLVLFRERMYGGSAMEYAFYPHEPRGPAGLGRFAGGAWRFPFQPSGVPDSHERTRKGPNGLQRWEEKLPIQGLASAGGKVFVSTYAGLYEGPGTWRQVLAFSEPAWEQRLGVSADRKRVAVWHGQKQTAYDPATGKSSDVPASSEEYHRGLYGVEWLAQGLNQSWTEIPTIKPGSWAIGELDPASHRVVETPRALWLVSPGQLIRLDRKLLPGWLR